jgi:hypothetical protein
MSITKVDGGYRVDIRPLAAMVNVIDARLRPKPKRQNMRSSYCRSTLIKTGSTHLSTGAHYWN